MRIAPGSGAVAIKNPKARRPMKIRTLIVDDERPAREELAFLLKSFPDVEVVGQAKNGIEAVQLVRDRSPQVVFLDVQMPGLDGLAVVRRLLEKKGPLPLFIFATAYEHYAVQAFEVNALDYLLKPIGKARLEKVLHRSRRMLEGDESTQEKIERLVRMVQEYPFVQKSKLLVKSGGRLFLVDSDNLVYATIQDGLISIHTREMEGQSNFRTIEDLQMNLDARNFWRVHRSYLVNINSIREVIPWFKSSYQLRMMDRKQTEIPVSRSQTRRLRELFNL